MHDHQRDLLLAPPDIDPDDRRRDERLAAWGQRLALAVQAGILTLNEAERAIDSVTD